MLGVTVTEWRKLANKQLILSDELWSERGTVLGAAVLKRSADLCEVLPLAVQDSAAALLRVSLQSATRPVHRIMMLPVCMFWNYSSWMTVTELRRRDDPGSIDS